MSLKILLSQTLQQLLKSILQEKRLNFLKYNFPEARFGHMKGQIILGLSSEIFLKTLFRSVLVQYVYVM